MKPVNRRMFLRYLLLTSPFMFTSRIAWPSKEQKREKIAYITIDTPIEKIHEAIAVGGVIIFFRGTYKLGEVRVPSNCTIIGSGQLKYDELNEKWQGDGTLILGSLNCNNANNFAISNITIDSFTGKLNSLYSVTAKTGPGYINNVTTRANNHGQLWEANDDNPENNNAIGNILITECTHYHGPNGFVTKQKNVTFRNCKVINIDVQAFVVVSDNINGSSIFSRATNSKIENCSVTQTLNNGSQGIRVYSRNYAKNDTVLGVDNVSINDFTSEGLGSNAITIGDNKKSNNYEKVISKNINLVINKKISSKYSELKLSHCDEVLIKLPNKKVSMKIETHTGTSNVNIADSGMTIEGCSLYDVSRGTIDKLKTLVGDKC
ncbi:hypothetical protein [Serratia sp. Res13-Sevr-LER1-36-b]|uniref:hypothetical protein n=3 Tax=unclassified Serratia (in: enterobacteria) TaxID=2647522 RepID=UPI0018A95E51|nr:hypothetical protein [Serratia sp. Res13-Sevr-LER1-36-b]